MMKIKSVISIAAIGFLFTNCAHKATTGRFEIHQVLPSGKLFFVEDSSQYSPEFIQELRTLDSQYDSVRVVGNNLIINCKDTLSIPTDLPLDKHVKYYSSKGDNSYCLDLKRINFTSIDYVLKRNNKIETAGQASMGAGFLFFGTETSSEANGTVYALTQYFEKKDCSTYIGVEIGNGNRVEFEMNCQHDSTKSMIPTFKKE